MQEDQTVEPKFDKKGPWSVWSLRKCSRKQQNQSELTPYPSSDRERGYALANVSEA